MTIRVSVPDVWDTIELSVNPEQTVAQVKHEALRRAVGERVDPGQFVVKYRGGQVLDETQTLASLGVRDRAPLIVLPARRRPVR
ncbi:MAG: hypothetical protein HY560_01990 [Gemmatimonadetes bacterium]|nr:hypothetical protein [Gemmatimonadota bacterium]